MKEGIVKPLKQCPMCGAENVVVTRDGKEHYRYECRACGQYFGFNAPSQFAADVIYNEVICGGDK